MTEQLSLSLVFRPCLLQEALHDPLGVPPPPPESPCAAPHSPDFPLRSSLCLNMNEAGILSGPLLHPRAQQGEHLSRTVLTQGLMAEDSRPL